MHLSHKFLRRRFNRISKTLVRLDPKSNFRSNDAYFISRIRNIGDVQKIVRGGSHYKTKKCVYERGTRD